MSYERRYKPIKAPSGQTITDLLDIPAPTGVLGQVPFVKPSGSLSLSDAPVTPSAKSSHLLKWDATNNKWVATQTFGSQTGWTMDSGALISVGNPALAGAIQFTSGLSPYLIITTNFPFGDGGIIQIQKVGSVNRARFFMTNDANNNVSFQTRNLGDSAWQDHILFDRQNNRTTLPVGLATGGFSLFTRALVTSTATQILTSGSVDSMVFKWEANRVASIAGLKTLLTLDPEGECQLWNPPRSTPTIQTSDYAGTFTTFSHTGGQVKDGNNDWQNIGFLNQPHYLRNTSYTFNGDECAKFIYSDNGTNYTYTTPASGATANDALAPGAYFTVANLASGTTKLITVAGGSGVTISWLNPPAAIATGSRTIAPGGVATVMKLTNTNWLIYGTGIA